MSTFASLLPQPKKQYQVYDDEQEDKKREDKAQAQKPQAEQKGLEMQIPPYLQRTRGFIPRTLEDFGDGGAYPEIHVAQFPLHMGRKDKKSANCLAVTVNKEGTASFDAIAKQGHGKKKTVYSSFTDIVEKKVTKLELERPSEEEEKKTAAKTQEALNQLISGKIASAQPLNVQSQKSAREVSTYFRYTPNPNAPGYNPNASQRVIRMVEAPSDPMDPPKFRHKKAPRGPPSPPVPVLHSPPRKITVKDQQAWKIPPSISNWKNAKGYTIPLDKRLAADGRGLQEVTINDKFAGLSEALAIAERKAREEVNMRAQVRKKLSMKEKEQKEAELRDMAARARMERSGLVQNDDTRRVGDEERREELEGSSGEEDDREGRRERDKIRYERKKEREREMRLEKLGKKGKLARDEDRDVSEKIALGQLQGTGAQGESMYDARLFNQSQGMSSGFGAEDEYSVYSKPLADRGAASSVYRPKASAEDLVDADAQYETLKKTERFRPDKEFVGTDRSGAQKRDGPVQFEKEVEQDPFGIDQFLLEAKKGKRSTMDSIGKSGGMAASGGMASREEYDRGSKRSKIDFASGTAGSSSHR